MKTQIIALEAHDDFISVRDRMSWAKSPRILLVWPKFEKITLRAADLRILQQHASYLGAEMGIITRRGDVRRDAERFGIPVFGSAAAAQRESWAPRVQSLPLRSGRKPRDRATLEALRDAANPPEASWRTRPISRVGFFVMAVLAVLAIAAVFVPVATVRLVPISQQQTLTLPVTASTSITAGSIAGQMPAHAITISAEGSQSARVANQSSIPDAKAKGIARFTNLSQSDLTIPQGTVIYSLSPAAVQFATVNETHLPGNVNAIVEVPIAAVQGGGAGNLPANAIQAIQGNLSLSASVTNPEPTSGGTDRVTEAPSEADRQRLHDVLVQLLMDQALGKIKESIGAGDMLLGDAPKMGQIAEETYDPPAGQPGSLLKLTLRTDFTAQYVKADDVRQAAEGALRSTMPAGFVPVDERPSMVISSEPTTDAAGAVHFNLQISRTVVRDIDIPQASAAIRGRPVAQAVQLLESTLPLAAQPQVELTPRWWPWMPLIPFRVNVTTAGR